MVDVTEPVEKSPRSASGSAAGRARAPIAPITVIGGVFGALLFAAGRFSVGGPLMLASALLLAWPSLRHPLAAASGGDTRARWALVIICVVAVFFRTYQLEPPGLWGDEAINGLRAFEVLDGTIRSPFQLVTHPHTAFHALSNYPIAAAFWLFGPGPVTLRLPGILAGIVCVPLLYGTFAPLFGAPAALIAALFFAVSPMQISHAKGLTQIVFGECAQLAGMCLLVRGTYGRRRWLMAAAGVPLAVCLYTYHSAKIAPLVAVFLFLWPLIKRDPARPPLRWWFAAAAMFFLSATPAIMSYAVNPDALTGRAGDVALWPVLKERGNLSPLWDAVWRTLTVYHYQQGPVEYHWFGLGTDPGADAIVAFLAIAGLLLSLRWWRETRHALLLGWFMMGVIPGILSVGAPRAYRILYATPAFYMWAALPLSELLASASAPGWSRRAVRSTVALVLMAVPLVDFNYYFYRLYTHPVFRWYQAQRMVEMARTLRSYGPGWTGVLLADSFDARYETLQFLTRAWELTLRNISSLADELPVRTSGAGVLFVFAPGNIDASIAIKAFYPDIELDVRPAEQQRTWWLDAWFPLGVHPEPQEPVAAFFPVSRATADSIHGLKATFSEERGQSVARVAPTIDVPADAVPDTGRITHASWTGSLFAPADGLYDFQLQTPDAANVGVGSRTVVSTEQATALEPLAQGLHPLTAAALLAPSTTLGLLWRPPGQQLGPISADNLYRIDHVFGLRADYTVDGRELSRIEPFPYYFFFAPTFDHAFTVHWHGTLQVPGSGYWLECTFNGTPQFTIDGRVVSRITPVAAGARRLDIVLRGVPPVARLQLYWRQGDSRPVLIPPQAFTPD